MHFCFQLNVSYFMGVNQYKYNQYKNTEMQILKALESTD